MSRGFNFIGPFKAQQLTGERNDYRIITIVKIHKAAFAVENEQTTNQVVEKQKIEVIEVSGYRGSLKKSLNTKRFSDAIVDAISAEDVGKFPEQTVADSLQRIPGVSIEKDFGEGDKVSIRGTSPHLNLTLINGQNLASATASAQVTKSSRGFNYSILPSEMVETLEVYKTAQADIDEGAIGGTVIVHTRKPLDTESNAGAFTVKGVHQYSSGETSPFISGFYSWKNDNEDLGINFSYTHKDNNMQRDSKEVRTYFREMPDDGGKIPTGVGYNRYTSNNILDTLTSTIQFAPTDDLDFTLTNIYSQVENSGQGTFTGSWYFNDNNVTDKEIVDGIIVGGSREAQGNDALYSNAGYEGKFDTFGTDLKAIYSGDNYEFVTQIGYTSAAGDVTDTYTEAYATTATSWDLTSGQPEVVFHDVDSADDFDITYAHVNEITNAEDEVYVQTDFKYFVEHDFFTSVKVGLKYRDHNKSSDLLKSDYSPSSPMSLAPFATGPTDDFYNGGSNDALYGFDQAAWNDYIASTDPKNVYERIDYFFDLNEKITASYLKANFSQDRLKGNFGIRYVKTDLSSAYWDYTGSKLNPDTQELKEVKHDYTDILPSINLNYDVSDDVVARIAVAKVMSRPDYDNLAGRRIYDCNCQNEDCKGSGGNPELDPYRANQFDLSVEWYFNSSSLFSVAYYYKDLESYITQQTSPEQLLDDEGIERTYDITKPVNGSGGTNKGYEINYQQSFAYGFGIQANYTFSDVDLIESEEQLAAGREALLAGNSEDTYNLTVYFENDDYSARVSYNYRSEYLYDEHTKYGNRMKGDYGQYDATLGYNLNEITTFTLQAINLTDAEQNWNYDGDENLVYQDHQYGRRIMLGVTVKL